MLKSLKGWIENNKIGCFVQANIIEIMLCVLSKCPLNVT